ncbi:MAG TPA: 1-deoxy-D-xylulose-5-phosphate reductoisomerase [Sphingomicrobium sp.]|nr:1-deoxy-D-xylulose-5-phosphate reductoisomerase [Sphingomicrobium sp.]
MSRRKIAVLGATGSVGQSTLDLVAAAPEQFEVVALTAATNVDQLSADARRFQVKLAVIADEALLPALRESLAGTNIHAAAGPAALAEAATGEADWVMAAIVGCAGLEPVMAAIEAGKTVALANKEALVTAGPLMTDAARRSRATILPVDSEHNAIFQCLAGQDVDAVARLILTASGGPFRDWSAGAMARVTPEQAVAHPNWSMGAKISIDSATMMNKGLELIEAHYLFAVPAERINIVVHAQSIVHSLVEYADGSMLAQLGPSDMRVPIAHTLGWPDRMATAVERLDLIAVGRLDFEKPDESRFPALRLAREALASGGAATVILNAANEVAVAAFLDRRIHFPDIAGTVERALASMNEPVPQSIAEVVELDRRARAVAIELMPEQVA